MTIEIRRLQQEDLPQLKSFFQTVIIDTLKKNAITNLQEVLEDEMLTKESYLLQDIQSNGKERMFLIAIFADEIVGIIGTYIANNYAVTLTNEKISGMTELGTVYIAPHMQGKGIGSLLVNSVLLHFKINGVKQFCLDSGYGTAQAVWTHKFGPPTYNFQNHWGENAHHMVWVIDLDSVPVTFG